MTNEAEDDSEGNTWSLNCGYATGFNLIKSAAVCGYLDSNDVR